MMDGEMLLPVEIENLRGEYRNYFNLKRHNYFASIQGFPELWDGFLKIDEIWQREFEDLQRITKIGDLLPSNMFMSSHAQYRIAFELGFSTCMIEASNVARNAIETAVQAHKIHREPKLAVVWSSKNDGPSEKKAFKKAFEEYKEDSLFPVEHGLRELYGYFCNYSEWGSHCSVDAMSLRHSTSTTSEDVQWNVEYFEARPERLGPFLATMLHAFGLVERACFDCFSGRLKLDHQLVNMRSEFDKRKRQAAANVIKRFNLKPPAVQLFRL